MIKRILTLPFGVIALTAWCLFAFICGAIDSIINFVRGKEEEDIL